MVGMQKTQEQFSADDQGWSECRKRRSSFQQMTKDGRNAEWIFEFS